MSARTDLLELLAADLDASFRVSADPPGSDMRLATGASRVTVQRAGATPASQTSGWGQTLAIYLLVGAEGYAAAEDALDDAVPTVVGVLESHHYPVLTIDRDVFFGDNDATGWHGYRITTLAITSTL